MPNKDFTLDSGLAVTVYKRRSSRSLRLSISPAGQVRVSIPLWAPYSTGLDFAKAREQWIRSQRKTPALLKPGQSVGKAHHLEFVASPSASKASGRVKSSLVTVTHPEDVTFAAEAVQNEAEKACIRALRSQAEQLLPQRLAILAQKSGFDYNQVSIKRLKSRWGSCDQHKNIVLNLFLMQLPWELIDYVLVHELVHTEVMRHGPDFWEVMGSHLPAVKGLRKSLREHSPVLATNQA